MRGEQVVCASVRGGWIDDVLDVQSEHRRCCPRLDGEVLTRAHGQDGEAVPGVGDPHAHGRAAAAWEAAVCIAAETARRRSVAEPGARRVAERCCGFLLLRAVSCASSHGMAYRFHCTLRVQRDASIDGNANRVNLFSRVLNLWA